MTLGAEIDALIVADKKPTSLYRKTIVSYQKMAPSFR